MMSVYKVDRGARRRAGFGSVFAWALLGCLASAGAGAHAGVAYSEISATERDGPVTLYYPTNEAPRPMRRGPFTLDVAVDAPPTRGNGRLVMISHGSGGSPWVHADLARALVDAGFVVAMPEHRADNYRDPSRPGPDSWSERPAEVSRAIDAVARDARFAGLLQFDKVGMYGMSAGGHTALSLAGGSWSPRGFRDHCVANLEDDFQSCVGLITQLTGGWLDGTKKWLARTVIGLSFGDATARSHDDPRIAAVVAGVPYCADFDFSSLERPRVPLALITAGKDRWLIPRFHSDRVLAACRTCELLADMPTAGHGALLSPLPPGFTGLVGELLNDPPGFDRGVLAAIDQKIVSFFARHLPAGTSGPGID